MHIVLAILTILGARAAEIWPKDLKGNSADAHVAAASAAAEKLNVKEDATEILLALAWVESRFDPTATSRAVDGKRITGSWPYRTQAGQGPWFCGVLQTRAFYSWKTCLEMRDLKRGYEEGVAELNYWLKKTNGNILQALNGHNCGNLGPTTACGGKGYGAFVLKLAKKLKAKTNS